MTSDRIALDPEKMIGLAELEIIEEHLIEGVIVILARVDHDVVGEVIEFLEDGGEADDLGASPEDGHHLQRFGHRGDLRE